MPQVRQIVVCALAVLCTACLVASPTPTALAGERRAPAARPDSVNARKARAEIAKLEQETRKLRGDNGIWGRLPGYGAVLAAFVALLGLFLTLRQQREDRRRDKETLDQQQEKDRQEREQASLRRFDEQFTQMVANLASDNPAVRAGAAASMRTFLKPEHAQFHDQVFTLLVANLKFPRGDGSDRIVARAFAQVLHEQSDLPALFGAGGLDLYEAQLRRVDLSNLDLGCCEMGRADLHGANLTSARLWRARGLEVNLSQAVLTRADLGEAHMRGANLEGAEFGEAKLVSAKLQEVKAGRASFDGASLQEANFDGADLRAATFRAGNLNNAFFRGTQFDEPALESVLLARHWRKANFDVEVLRRLEEMAGQDSGEAGSR